MTQKELSYVEDAIGHEDNIIKIINYSIENISDEELVSFMEDELEEHESIKNKLIKLLKEKANE